MEAHPNTGPFARISRWLPAAAISTLAAPTLVLAYLPMTDLPQHLAVVSMWLHMDDPRFGFEAFYELAPGRTLYFVPYAIALALCRIMPLALAMHVVVFLSVIAYPLGVLAVLRATGRAGVLALLAVPLMYNRAFFWGFVNFNLALGMALYAVALLERPVRSVRARLGLGVLCIAISLTHAYGIAIVAGYVGVGLIFGDRGKLARNLLPLAPLGVGTAAWLAAGRDAVGRGKLSFDSLTERFLAFEDATLGGYPDWTDESLLVLMVATVACFCARRLPWTADRWRALDSLERTALLYSTLNFALYWVLPTHTESALFLHFRHALLAVALLPLLATDGLLRANPRAGAALLGLLAVATAAVHWTHLVRFDREARPFDAVLAELPEQPKLHFLCWDRAGDVIQTNPYHHFHAYVLAQRGGVTSFSFPEMFWNIPVTLREEAGVPRLPLDVEWHPELFDDEAIGGFYDWVLVRNAGDGSRGVDTLPRFSYELVFADPPWELYRRRAEGD
ncbi:MAG: hypothetical protein ACE5FL_15535 [Myxococcota bacterium]